MPFHIDRFRGSLHVQGMPGAAKWGYLSLLASAWQSDDCTLPTDNYELQILADLTAKEWKQFGALILRRFTEDNGRLINRVLFDEWSEAKANYERKNEQYQALREARIAAGRAGGLAKASKCLASAKQTPSKSVAKSSLTKPNHTIHEEQIPSRVKAASDPRHVPFKLAVETYATFKHVKLPWDGSEAKALDLLLKSAPDLTLADFQVCLNHRARSPGTPHGERPRVWLPHVLKYQEAPLDQFGKTEGSNGTGSYQGKTRSSLNAAHEAIAILQQREDGANRADAGETWGETTGEAGAGRLLGSG